MGKNSQNEQVRSISALLKARLSKKRYTHSVNVARAAFNLAELWGEDPERAYLAGLLHDCCKEIPFDEQAELMRTGPFEVSEDEWRSKPVWHGIAAASYMHTELSIDDMEMLGAARWHTVGCAHMSRLEEIVYMADLISADRNYHDVEHFRKLAHSDLNRALFEALRYSIENVLKKGNLILISTAEAYNRYLLLTQESPAEDSK